MRKNAATEFVSVYCCDRHTHFHVKEKPFYLLLFTRFASIFDFRTEANTYTSSASYIYKNIFFLASFTIEYHAFNVFPQYFLCLPHHRHIYFVAGNILMMRSHVTLNEYVLGEMEEKELRKYKKKIIVDGKKSALCLQTFYII